MRTIAVSALKAGLAEQLRDVKAGEELIITERGTAIARILPIAHMTDEIASLTARGIARPGRAPLGDSFFDLPMPNDPERLLRRALDPDREDRA